MTFLRRLNTTLYRFYYKNLSRTKWKIVRCMKAEFFMQPSNYIDRRMWIEGCYEEEQLTYLLEHAQKLSFDAFIDVGANFGLYSCILGANGVVSSIHCFECDPRNLYHLYGHLRMNCLMDSVTVHPYAVGDKEGTIQFQIASDKSTGHSHVGESVEGYDVIYSKEETKEDKSIIIDQIAIDAVFDFQGKNLLFKIDVEGYEKIALKGMKRVLSKNSCLLQIEIVDDGNEQTEILNSMGYRQTHKIGNDWYFTNSPLQYE